MLGAGGKQLVWMRDEYEAWKGLLEREEEV